MRSKTRFMAPFLAAAAIGAAVFMAPVALAESSTATAPLALPQAIVINPAPSPAPTPQQSGGDPQVPDGPTLGFDSNNFDGNSLAY